MNYKTYIEKIQQEIPEDIQHMILGKVFEQTQNNYKLVFIYLERTIKWSIL